MRSGKLDRKITLQQIVVVRGNSGGESVTWEDMYDLFAERETTAATERFAASQRIAEVDTLYRVRWNSSTKLINPKTHRITYRSRWYEILAVVEIGRNEGAWIACKSRGDLGGTP